MDGSLWQAFIVEPVKALDRGEQCRVLTGAAGLLRKEVGVLAGVLLPATGMLMAPETLR